MKKKMISALALTASASLIAIGCTIAEVDAPGHKTTGDRPSPSAPASADGPATSFTDGTFLVGSDIEAGTYKTPGDDTGLGCYWERASDDSGDFGTIIANEYADGPGRVTVKAGEVFKTSGDCEWRLVR